MANRLLLIVAALWAATIVLSCNKGSSDIVATQANIHGSWQHDYHIEPDFTVPPNFKLIRFEGDSFYMRYDWATEIMTPKCPEAKGTSYVKGKYEIKDGKLYLNGVFSTPDYMINNDSSGCLSVGNWADSFKVSLTDKITVNLYWLIPLTSMPEAHRRIKLNRIN